MKIQAAIFALVALGTATAANLPSSWKTCKRDSQNYNTCLKEATTGVLKELKSGNSALKLSPLDPVRIEKITLKQGAGTAVGLTINFKNLIINGLSNGKVESMNINHKKREITIDYSLQSPLKMQGDYTSKGRILLIPLNGVGKSTLVFDDFKGKCVLRCKSVKKGGQEFWEVLKTDINIETSRLHLNFKRTQNINEGLGANLNTFLNENWKEILQDLKPAISKEFGSIFKNYANSLFSQVPFDQISPA
ncbi:protein takeout-like [Cimex lectularius]|uniref:Takeout n=1 Tax=Cimex lectularius TaxID=79782 RepID=A0A8I6R7K1_CIMLE|nr:protein takeout-like [Cimex lectularius]